VPPVPPHPLPVPRVTSRRGSSFRQNRRRILARTGWKGRSRGRDRGWPWQSPGPLPLAPGGEGREGEGREGEGREGEGGDIWGRHQQGLPVGPGGAPGTRALPLPPPLYAPAASEPQPLPLSQHLTQGCTGIPQGCSGILLGCTGIPWAALGSPGCTGILPGCYGTPEGCYGVPQGSLSYGFSSPLPGLLPPPGLLHYPWLLHNPWLLRTPWLLRNPWLLPAPP